MVDGRIDVVVGGGGGGQGVGQDDPVFLTTEASGQPGRDAEYIIDYAMMANLGLDAGIDFAQRDYQQVRSTLLLGYSAMGFEQISGLAGKQDDPAHPWVHTIWVGADLSFVLGQGIEGSKPTYEVRTHTTSYESAKHTLTLTSTDAREFLENEDIECTDGTSDKYTIELTPQIFEALKQRAGANVDTAKGELQSLRKRLDENDDEIIVATEAAMISVLKKRKFALEREYGEKEAELETLKAILAALAGAATATPAITDDIKNYHGGAEAFAGRTDWGRVIIEPRAEMGVSFMAGDPMPGMLPFASVDGATETNPNLLWKGGARLVYAPVVKGRELRFFGGVDYVGDLGPFLSGSSFVVDGRPCNLVLHGVLFEAGAGIRF